MHRSRILALCAVSAGAGTLATTAIAADPDKGTVSAETPKVTWKGELTGSYFALLAFAAASDAGQPEQAPCEAGCDSFALNVAKQADLTIGADSPGDGDPSPDSVAIRVKKPDGSTLITFGDSQKGKPMTIKFKNAATGDYVIDYTNNYETESAYDAFAQLAIAAPAPPAQTPGGNNSPPPPPLTEPVPGSNQQGSPPTPGGVQTPGASSQPGSPQQAQNIDLTIKPGKASVRKLKKSRKLTATVKVSREVASLVGTLRKGSKKIATARRGKTAGTVKVTLKLSKKTARKLKKGTLKLSFAAKDAQGTTVSKTVKVKVRK